MDKKPSEYIDQAYEMIDLDQYGIGVPAGIFTLGLAILFRSAEGVIMFNDLTMYGQVGVSVMVTTGVGFVAIAGYLYNEIDFSWWLLTKDDAPELGETDES